MKTKYCAMLCGVSLVIGLCIGRENRQVVKQQTMSSRTMIDLSTSISVRRGQSVTTNLEPYNVIIDGKSTNMSSLPEEEQATKWFISIDNGRALVACKEIP